jgi:FtsH-binding integral membrane protein
MGALVVGLIGIVCTVAAVVIPIWLENNAKPGIPLISAPAPFPVLVIIGLFTSAGFFMTMYAAESGTATADAAVGVAFFLTITAIASALFGRCAVSRNLRLGSYLGYVAAAFAALLLLWAAIGGDLRSLGVLSAWGFLVFTIALLVSLVNASKKAK